MPTLMPKEYASTIYNLKFDKLLSNIPNIQESFLAPRAVLGNGQLPETMPFQSIMMNPSYLKWTSSREEIPDMIKHWNNVPNNQHFNPKATLLFGHTNTLPNNFSTSLLILSILQKFIKLLLQKSDYPLGKNKNFCPKNLKAKQNRGKKL